MRKIKIKKPRSILSWNYSFLVTLPKLWLELHGIGKGDRLVFEIDEHQNLVIKPLKEDG